MNRLTRKDTTALWLGIAIFILAILARLYGTGMFPVLRGDERMHVPSAYNYTERGYFGPDNWYHPPLKHLLLYGSIKLFGDNPYGWRMRNVLFGAATVVMLFILARLMFSSNRIAVVSAALLLLDPLHIRFSRATFEDIPAVFFLLTGIYFAFTALQNKKERDWILSGIAFGLSVALKWYCLNVLAVTLALALYHSWKEERAVGLLRPVSYLTLLPASIYLLCFIPWFKRGYSLPEWILMQQDALREMSAVTAQGFRSILNELGGPAKWFTQIVGGGFELSRHDSWGAYLAIMNNLPVWVFIVPSLCYALYVGIRENNAPLIYISASFWSIYLPLLIIDRPIFLYTSLSLLPFGFLAVGFSADRLLKKWVFIPLLAAVFWCLYLYPVNTCIPVPLKLYLPLLRHIKMIGAP